MKTQVSIIIPTYNHAKYLPDAIKSCLAQTYPDIEIIVVDDDSTDNTREVVARYSQVTYIHQPNQGPATARNTGWRQSRGAYLQFLDADDLLLPTKIEKCMAVFDSHPEIGVVYTESEIRSADLKQTYPIDQVGGHGLETLSLRSIILRTWPFFPPHGPLIDRRRIEQVGGFDESLRHADDWLMWVSLAAYGVTFYRVPEALVIHRKLSGSYSSHSLDMARERVRIAEKFRTLPIPATTVDIDAVIADRYAVLALNLWRSGKRSEARQHYRHAIALTQQGRFSRKVLVLFSYMLPANMAHILLNGLLRLRGVGKQADASQRETSNS